MPPTCIPRESTSVKATDDGAGTALCPRAPSTRDAVCRKSGSASCPAVHHGSELFLSMKVRLGSWMRDCSRTALEIHQRGVPVMTLLAGNRQVEQGTQLALLMVVTSGCNGGPSC
jgi:hypothetical protein